MKDKTGWFVAGMSLVLTAALAPVVLAQGRMVCE